MTSDTSIAAVGELRPDQSPLRLFAGATIPDAPPGPPLASVLLLAAVDAYGMEVLLGSDEQRWDPQTLALEIAQDVGGLVPQLFDRLMSAIELLTTDHFLVALPDFIRICNLLNDAPSDAGFDWAEPHEIAWAIIEQAVITGGDDQNYHPEIISYVKSQLQENGITRVPPLFASITGQENESLVDPDTDAAEVSDDPELFADVEDRQSTTVREILDGATRRVVLLLAQIDGLPLSSGRGTEWKQKILLDIKKVLVPE